MKICPSCGTQCNDTMRYCLNCGAPLAAGAGTSDGAQNGTYRTVEESEYRSPGQGQVPPVTRRSIALYIILTLVTCGIFYLYWMAVLNDDINRLTGDHDATSGGMVVLFSILTCGIYTFFWFFKTGDKVDRLKGTQNTNIIYLVLCFLGLSIVGLALAQDEVNRWAAA